VADNVAVAHNVHQGGICLRILFFADETISLQLDLAPVEVVESWVSLAASAGPLGVKFRLRPLIAVVGHVGEDVGDRLRADVSHVALPRKPKGASARRLV
jgi:hypothetical protein